MLKQSKIAYACMHAFAFMYLNLCTCIQQQWLGSDRERALQY
ncbi:MAG: hypothetical protein AB4050_14915 [Synechococcus sp.]